ncbi:uncharacterized protein EDB91DRAFT_1082744 [Suillus paluster]|uniref:uncharacterized protein n=1 Tax=Suillus paluster TaxID=48578 RepID=UPI001B8828F2|nr:uncharacterized protein EDB91DRAFT_1082744 [Suillus paluster]KAG1738350.1 hypothetical protein EDB91DRAFT_1082744 [Suillus paluster]
MTYQHLNLQLPSSSSPQASSSGPTAPPEAPLPMESAEPPADQGRSTTRTKTAATRQSARIASAGTEAEDAAPPQGSTSQTTPLPGVPAKSTAKPAAKPSAKQAATKQTPPINAPDAPSPQAPPAPAPPQKAADITALLARIAQLEQEQAARTMQPAEIPHRTVPPMLFTSPEEVEKARAATTAARKDKSKVTLLEIVPGYKANPLDTAKPKSSRLKMLKALSRYVRQQARLLVSGHEVTKEGAGGRQNVLRPAYDHRHTQPKPTQSPQMKPKADDSPCFFFTAIPPKVDEVFKASKYVPYSALTSSARWQAIRSGEEAFVISASGLITARGLDRQNERSISLSDWIGAANAVEERTEHYHGAARAKALRAHHSVVLGLSRSHSWNVAVEYDIQQREMVVQHPQHDLSQLDDKALTIIATCIVARQPALTATYSTPQFKRPLPPSSSSSSQQPPKKKSRLQCFQCGGADHLPGDCTAESTITGHPAAQIAASAKSAHTLAAPGGKIFCIGWA